MNLPLKNTKREMPIKSTINEIAEVVSVNGVILSVATFSNLEVVLKIILLIITILYTADKWYKSSKNKGKKDY